MKLLKNFPFWVASYIAVVGLIFIFLTVFQTPYIEFKQPNKYFVTVGSFIFFILGVVYGYLALRGKLESKGPSVTEIRKQSLEKIKTSAYLAKIAKEDSDPKVRQAAIKRLEEITNRG
jgi:preprotein translocase subunit SecF